MNEDCKTSPTAQPWVPTNDPFEVALAGKALEELSELSKVISRMLIQGFDGVNPTTGKTNIQELREEIGDAFTFTIMLADYCGIPEDAVEERIEKKLNFCGPWLEWLKNGMQGDIQRG